MSIKPYLRLLQTPVLGPNPASQPMHFDRSRPAPHTDALRAAWTDGNHRGLHTGYLQGWRYGLLCGACTLAAAASLLLGVAAGLGWL